jgi:hypothetical protein
MKFRIKNTPETAQELWADNVPDAVIDKILGKTFIIPKDDALAGHFSLSVPFAGQDAEWRIKPSCVELVEAEVE